jgi:hypothetical protein
LLSRLDTGILVVAKLQRAVPVCSAERYLVTESKTIKRSPKIRDFHFNGYAILFTSFLIGKYFCGETSHVRKVGCDFNSI